MLLSEKPIARKRIFVQTPFPPPPHILFRRDQNHNSILTSKIMTMCELMLKKQRPNTIQIF